MLRPLALAALTLVATPAWTEIQPDELLDRAQLQVRALDRDIDQVRHPHVRRDLEARVERLDRILRRIERTGALEPRHGPPGRPGRPGPPRAGGDRHVLPVISAAEARRMVRAERYDQAKLDVLRGLARHAHFSTVEIRDLAAELTYDSHRAEALIILHPTAIDPHRYRLALEALTYRSSRQRVARTLGI